jgi:hypothetical protein
MWITGRPEGAALLAPPAVTTALTGMARCLGALTGQIGQHVDIDGPALLGERAAIAGWDRRGTTSVGGATRLVRAADGWLAVSLARHDDVALLPAWLEVDIDQASPWPQLETNLGRRPARELVARASMLGLPVARLGETVEQRPVIASRMGSHGSTTSLDDVVVVDLSSLWAGPLAGSLLAEAGAHVVKVEDVRRRDGARRGPTEFFDLMNAGKELMVLDFAAEAGREALRNLLARADVVIEASRPRALEQLGCDVHAIERHTDGRGPRVWVSITAHGRQWTARDRVGFGDDTAVAGGLVATDDDGPVFLADAVADPITGLVATVAVLDRLTTGDRWHLDLALARTAKWLSGPTPPAPASLAVAAPRARPRTTRHPR